MKASYLCLAIVITTTSYIFSMEESTSSLDDVNPLLYVLKAMEFSEFPPELKEMIIGETFALPENSQALLKAMNDNNDNKIEQLLKKRYIDVNIQDDNGRTPLIWAVEGHKPEIVKILLEKNANLNIPDNDGNTPLIHAAMNTTFRNSEIVQILLDAGANPNIQNNNGSTALMYTSRIDVLKMLLDHGADLNIQNNGGYTALDLSRFWDQPEITNLLSTKQEGK